MAVFWEQCMDIQLYGPRTGTKMGEDPVSVPLNIRGEAQKVGWNRWVWGGTISGGVKIDSWSNDLCVCL